MKRIAALFLSVLLILSVWVVRAEDTQWCYYKAPAGVELYPLQEFGTQLAPEGLEAMYDSLTDARDDSNVHIFRMPNGRALVSVACYTNPDHGTVQDLYDNWDAIAASLGQNALSFKSDRSCVSIEEKYGFEALCINTEMVPASDPSLTLTKEGIVLFDGIDMIETWVVYPIEKAAANIPLLQSDLSAVRELQSSFEFVGEKLPSVSSASPTPDTDGINWDILHDFAASPTPDPGKDVEDVLNNLNFVINNGGDQGIEPSPEPTPAATTAPNSGLIFAPVSTPTPIPDAGNRPEFDTDIMQSAWQYADPMEQFTIWLSEGTTVLTADSSEEAFSAERQRWADKLTDGATLFDLFCEDVESNHITLFSQPEYGIAIRVSKESAHYFKDYSVEDYLALTEPMRENLAESYDVAETLESSGFTATFSDLEHAAMSFYLEHGNAFITNFIFAATDKEGNLREVDLFAVADAQGEFHEISADLMLDILYSAEYLYTK